MTESYPSTRITIGDVPEVRDFRAKFVYNFFVPDERTQRFGNVPDKVRKSSAESFDSERIDRISKFTPRFVRFDFCPVVADDQGPNEFIKRHDNAGRGSATDIISALRQKIIQSEEDFSNNRFVGLNFQDDNVDLKLRTMVSGSIAKRVTSHNRLKRQQIENQKQQIIDLISDQHSLMDAAKALADQTSNQVTNDMIVNALNNIDSLRLSFIDNDGSSELIDKTFERIKDVTVKAQFNNKIVGDVVKQVVDDPMSPFSDEFAPILEDALAKQQEALASDDPNVIQRNDFDTLFEAINVTPVDSEDLSSSVRFVGYIIDKHELRPKQRPVRRTSIVLEDPTVATAIDLDVAYGATYVYTIRAVAELTVKVVVDDSDDVVIATGLVTSRTSPRKIIKCVENVPPPPPVDLNVFWDYQQNHPLLIWNFPTNPQRDVKKFQVFRRSSVMEPFQLIKEYDFDDSLIKTPNPESPEQSLVETLRAASTTFRDDEFTKDSKFIYAVCAVDAHQLTSNYSLQMEVSFDRLSNKIVKRLISISGAPKSYPNMLLNQDLFVDTIKTSGKTRCRMFFDAELLELHDSAGNDMKLIARSNVDGGQYRFQLINTDVLKQEVVDVLIDDKRLPSERG